MKTAIESTLARRKRVLKSYKNEDVSDKEIYTPERLKNINIRIVEIEGFIEDLEYILKHY